MTDDVNDVIGRNVRTARAVRAWSVEDLSKRCTMYGHTLTPTAIYLIEGGGEREGRTRRRVTVDELLTLSRAFAVTPAELLPELSATPVDIPSILRRLADQLSANI